MANYRVNEIEWNALMGASGNCSHYSIVFQHLQSDNRAICEKAYSQLENHAVVQGTLYESAPYVCDILVGFLQFNKVFHCKFELYDFLTEAVFGDSLGEDCSSYLNADLPIKTACILAIRNGVDAYVADLLHKELLVRIGAADLLLATPYALTGRNDLIEKVKSINSSNADNKRLLRTLNELLASY